MATRARRSLILVFALLGFVGSLTACESDAPTDNPKPATSAELRSKGCC